MYNRLKHVWMVLVLLLAAQRADAQLLAVSTDLAMDVVSVPNIGLELGVGERGSVVLNGLMSSKVLGHKFKAKALQPEYRYWFGGRPMHRHFVGVGSIIATYDVDWDSHIYKGEAAGLGVTFGYVWSLSSRFNIDFHAGLGVIAYKHKEYYTGDHYEYFTQEKNASGYWLLPTRIGISAAFILK